MSFLDLPEISYPRGVLADMVDWIGECNWSEDFDPRELTDGEVINGIKEHYAGGLDQFLSDFEHLKPGDPLPYWHRTTTPTTRSSPRSPPTTTPKTGGCKVTTGGPCHTHKAWLADCVIDPTHANPVTGFNWCGDHYQPVQLCGCRPASAEG